MSKVAINVGTSPNDWPGYPTKESDDNGNWTVTEKYWQASGSVATNLPAHNATTNQHGNTVQDPDGNTLKCRKRRISEGNAPGVATVELTYSRTTTTLSYTPPADNPRSVRLRGQEIPIDDERLLTTNGGKLTQAQVDAAKAAGHVSDVIYGIEYTYTELDASFTWSEANIVSTLQATGTPTGISSGTAANWRLIGKEIDEAEDGQTVIKTHWEFNPTGFVAIST